MKLRNKKTGFVTNWCIDEDVIRACDGSIKYNSLAELNEEWEDVPEEPKEHWYIGDEGDLHPVPSERYIFIEFIVKLKEIGNYFEIKEEAEKAVERLRAWKRLKDKGFRFDGGDDACISYKTDIENWSMQDLQDFKTIFGGEE